jgi:hypothetical protein
MNKKKVFLIEKHSSSLFSSIYPSIRSSFSFFTIIIQNMAPLLQIYKSEESRAALTERMGIRRPLFFIPISSSPLGHSRSTSTHPIRLCRAQEENEL